MAIGHPTSFCGRFSINWSRKPSFLFPRLLGFWKMDKGLWIWSYPLIHQTRLSFSKLGSTFRDPSAKLSIAVPGRDPGTQALSALLKASHPVSYLVAHSPQATHLGPNCTYLLQWIPDLPSWGLCLAGSLCRWHTCVPLLLVPSWFFSRLHPHCHTSLPPGSPPRFPCLGWHSLLFRLCTPCLYYGI